MVIGPNGELYKCEHHVGRKDCVVGTCKDGRFYSDVEMNFVSGKVEDRCKMCKYLPLCFGGCRSEDLLGRDYESFCRSVKMDINEIMKLRIKDYKNKINSMYGSRR